MKCRSIRKGTVSYTVISYINVVVRDLAYVRVGMSLNYICFHVDLFNRERIGYSVDLTKY